MKPPLDIDRLPDIFPKRADDAPLEPELVIAAVLSMVRWSPGNLYGPDDRVVTLIMTGLRQAGLQIVPIKKDSAA